MKIFTHLTIPFEILTDRGTNFVSTFMREVYQFLGIDHIKTVSYRPQSTGCVERFHFTQIVWKSGRFTRLGRLLALLPLRMQGGTIDSHRLFAFPVVIRESSISLDVLHQQWVPTTKTLKDPTEWIQHMREMLGENQESAR